MGTNVRQCRECRKLFQSLGSSVCPDCAEETDRRFNTVKDYLFNHPNANVVDIANDTGIAEKIVLNFLREGRLSLNTAEGSALECEKCRAPIPHGRFCAICQSKLQGLLGGAVKPEATKSEGKMAGSAKMYTEFGSK